jgi:hypothetical protein
MPLTEHQQTRILAIAEQLHELAQSAREGRPAGTSQAAGRSVEHIVTELTFLSTILFDKAQGLNSRIPNTTFGQLRNDYLSGDGTVERLMEGFGLDPKQEFDYKDIDTKEVKKFRSSINLTVLNHPDVKTIARSLWAKDFMSAEYGGEPCTKGQQLLVDMARVLDEDSRA